MWDVLYAILLIARDKDDFRSFWKGCEIGSRKANKPDF